MVNDNIIDWDRLKRFTKPSEVDKARATLDAATIEPGARAHARRILAQAGEDIRARGMTAMSAEEIERRKRLASVGGKPRAAAEADRRLSLKEQEREPA